MASSQLAEIKQEDEQTHAHTDTNVGPVCRGVTRDQTVETKHFKHAEEFIFFLNRRSFMGDKIPGSGLLLSVEQSVRVSGLFTEDPIGKNAQHTRKGASIILKSFLVSGG